MSLNMVILNGYVGKDPEIKTFQDGGKVANFTMATSKKGYTTQSGTVVPDKTTWHNITAKGNIVKAIEPYVKKGDYIGIIGEISQREYTNTAGVKSYFNEIIANEIQFFPSQKAKPDGNTEAQQEEFKYAKPTPPINSAPGMEEPTPADDLPF